MNNYFPDSITEAPSNWGEWPMFDSDRADDVIDMVNETFDCDDAELETEVTYYLERVAHDGVTAIYMASGCVDRRGQNPFYRNIEPAHVVVVPTFKDDGTQDELFYRVVDRYDEIGEFDKPEGDEGNHDL